MLAMKNWLIRLQECKQWYKIQIYNIIEDALGAFDCAFDALGISTKLKVSNGWSKTCLSKNVRSEYDHHLKQMGSYGPVTFFYGKWWKVVGDFNIN